MILNSKQIFICGMRHFLDAGGIYEKIRLSLLDEVLGITANTELNDDCLWNVEFTDRRISAHTDFISGLLLL